MQPGMNEKLVTTQQTQSMTR